MLKKFILGQIRHALTTGGGSLTTYLIASGASPDDASVIVSGLIAVIGFIWSAWNARSHDVKEKKVKTYENLNT